MLNSRHETLKEENSVYLSRLGDYYALLGNLYYAEAKYDFSMRCFESALKVWMEFGLDVKELKYQKAQEFKNACLDCLKQNPQ